VIDRCFDCHSPTHRTRKTKNPSVWKTRDGRIVNVKDMETAHIMNCIKMLKASKNNPEQLACLREILVDRKNLDPNCK
jgi:hypothetical protein